MKIIKQFKGNSGCRVELCEDEGQRYVRKTSHEDAYNRRLSEQMRRLDRISELGNIAAPRVLSVGHDTGGNFFYTMEYVSGVSLAEYLLSASIVDALAVFTTLLGWIDTNKRAASRTGAFWIDDVAGAKTRDLFRADASLAGDMRSLPWFSHNQLPVSFYHGDLTFENIIVRDGGELVLIDPLESYMPNFFADVTKICTELFCFWSRLNSGVEINVGVYSVLRDALLNSSVYEQYGSCMETLVAIDMLRTVPYLRKHDPGKVDDVREAVRCLVSRRR